MKRRIRFLIPLVLAAAAGVAAWRGGWFNNSDPNLLQVSGNIELTEVDISFKLPGKLAELSVKEGGTVQRGQLIARIDRESVERQKSREEAGLAAARAALEQARTAVDFQQTAVENEIALKRAGVAQAKARLEELEAGSRPQEIEQARAALRDIRSVHEQARRDWERAQTLYKNEDISTAQYDQFRARHDSSSAAVKQAEERLALVEEGPRKEVIAQARAQLAAAEAALKLAEANRLEVRRREQELDLRRAEIERARAQVSVMDSQLDDTLAASPVDGVVLVKSVEPGEVVAAGTSIVTIGDLDRPWLRAYVPERDLGRVQLGQKVKLTTDSFPGKEYWGRVTFIASEAEFTPKQIQTPEERVKLVYRLKIEVDNPRHELKSNMPVDAGIVLAAR